MARRNLLAHVELGNAVHRVARLVGYVSECHIVVMDL